MTNAPMRFQGLLFVLVLVIPACAHPRPAAGPSEPDAQDRLAAADALVRVGCFDCLLDAYREYDALRSVAAVADAAKAGAVGAATLIALRQRQLGMADDGYFERAGALLVDDEGLQERFSVLLDILDTTTGPRGHLPGEIADPEVLRRGQRLRAHRAEWREWLRARADEDAWSAAAWVWFACSNSLDASDREPDALVASLARFREALLVTYEVATCSGGHDQSLDEFLAREPKFHEIEYWLGLRDIRNVHLEDAEARLTSASAWHPRWPLAIVSQAALYMTAEEFQAALDRYDSALALVPDFADALIGRVRALSYLERHADAIAGANNLLASERLPGEAYYWRAWNAVYLDRLEDAWRDVEQARRLWVNAEVEKLGGTVAYRRRQLEMARSRFEAARALRGNDCETLFDLGNVHAELGAWSSSVSVLADAATCLERSRSALAAEIEGIRASQAGDERKAHQIARREQEIATADHMLIQSWFNTAVAYFNLSNPANARSFAERVVGDEQLGERARALLSRIDARP
jgi:tetratricopeptide (TPR) repeat protein